MVNVMTKEDLSKFCAGPDFPVAGIDKPWSADVYSFATNGHLLIRVKRLDDVPENPTSPKTFHLWPKTIPPFVEMPDFPAPAFIQCGTCAGTGIYKNKSICDNCDGEGKFPRIIKVNVGNCCFSNHYLAMIKDFPGFRFAPHPTDIHAAAYFSFNAGDGLLMPVRP